MLPLSDFNHQVHRKQWADFSVFISLNQRVRGEDAAQSSAWRSGDRPGLCPLGSETISWLHFFKDY